MKGTHICLYTATEWCIGEKKWNHPQYGEELACKGQNSKEFLVGGIELEYPCVE